MNLLDELLGPLATLECQRAVRPRWVTWVRTLAGVPTAGVVLVVVWCWMLFGQLETGYLPGRLLTGGLVAAEVAQIFLALLLSPALIAGTIAGEKDRGTLAMLLASRIDASDIVLGRLVGCFSQVALFLAAGLPLLLLLAALCHANVLEMLLLVALPVAIAAGSAGMTVAASTLARRGRDALLTVYAIEVLLIVGPLFGGDWQGWLVAVSPLASIYPLAADGAVQSAAISVAWWVGFGVAGTALAIWQLRPTYIRQTGGESSVRRSIRRRVPPLVDHPMLWKELYLDRSGSFGAFGQWLIRLLTLLLVGGGIIVLAALGWQFLLNDSRWVQLADSIARAIGVSSTFLLWFAQWIIGLRAVGLVAAERQRSTWDAILASPLDQQEILMAKSWGSVYGLRWLIVAMCLAWSAAALAGGMGISDYLNSLAMLVAGGALMVVTGVAVGVAMSAASTTRGMAITIAIWIGAAVTTAVVAFLVAMISSVAVMALWATYALATSSADMFKTGPTFTKWLWPVAYAVVRLVLYSATTAIVWLWLATNFDRLAGRMGGWSISQRVVGYFDGLIDPLVEEPAQQR